MDEKINLLFVEDSEFDAILTVHELRLSGLQVVFKRVQERAELEAALKHSEWDAVLSDYNLPSFSAEEALELVHQSGKDLPFIVVSGTIGEETAVKMMRAGAHDYMRKDNLNRLGEVIRREMREANLRQEHHRAEAALKASEEQFHLLFERSTDAIFLVEKETGRYLDANHAAEKLTGRSLAEIKTLTIFDISPVGAKKRLEQVNSAPEVAGLGEVTYYRPDGSFRIATLSTIPVNDQLVFGIAHDVTEKKQAEDALKRHAQELEALYRTSLKINAQTDLLALLQTLVEEAASLLNACMGGLYLMQPDGQSLKLVVAHNLPGNYLGVSLKLGEGLSGKVAETRQPLMVSDYSSWNNHAAVYAATPFKRVLGVPMTVKDRVIGVINISDDVQVGEYSTEEVRLLNLFADQAAIAVENTRLLGALQQELGERKQAEESLRTTKQFLDRILEAVPLGISIFNIKTRKMEFANEVDTNFSGMTIDQFNEADQETLWEMVHADDRQRRREFIQTLISLRDGESRGIEYRRKNKKEQWRWYYYRYFVFERDLNGSISKLLTVADDITERKRAEEALHENMVELQDAHQRLQFHVNRMSLGFIVLNRDRIITEWNPAAETIFGWKSQEAIGQHDFLIVPPEVRPHVASIWDNMTNGEERSSYSVDENITKDGHIITCEWHNSPLLDPDGNVIGFLAMCNDITERKRSEQAIERQLKELTLLHTLALAEIRMNTLDDLVRFVTNQVGSSFHLDSFGVLFLDEKGDDLHLHPSYHGDMQKNPDTIPVNSSISGRVITTGLPYRVGDVTKDPYHLKLVDGIQSELCVPIKIGEKTLGVINAESRHPSYFTEDDERLLTTIAGQMASAIERIRLFEYIQISLEKLNQAYESTIEGWSLAMDLRDKDTENHTKRVTELTVRLAQAIGFSPDEMIHIRRGALLHDIGKIGVPDSILLKPDTLTPEEWVLMRKHPEFAYEMISSIEYLRPALDIPYCHHEYWDGSGYPRGLKGDEIPLPARIFAIVDVWDALTADRSYRTAWSREKTLDYLQSLSGKQFDPHVVREFLKLMGK